MRRAVSQFSMPARERGAVTLVMALVLLASMTLMTVFTGRSVLMEQRVSVNDYKAKQLAEAADAGLDFAIQWLNANLGTVVWTTDNSVAGYDQRATNAITTTLATGHTATVTIRRLSTVPLRLLLVSSASPVGSTVATEASTVVKMNALMTTAPGAAFLVDGCMSGITGNPDAFNDDDPSGPVVVSSQDASCLDEGHLGYNGGTEQGNAFTGTAWDRTFGITKAQFQVLANADAAVHGTDWANRTYVYVTDTANWHNDLGQIGPPMRSTILVFAPEAECPKINGGTRIVGIVYYEGDCTTNGWGGADVFGSVIKDGDITQFTANANIHYSDAYVSSFGDAITGVKSRVPGSWIDRD